MTATSTSFKPDVRMFRNHRNIRTPSSLIIERRSRDYCNCSVDFFLLILLRRTVPAEPEQPYAIVCFEYAVIGTFKVLLDSPVISEVEMIHVEQSFPKLTSLVGHIGQQRLLVPSNLMYESSGITGIFVRTRVYQSSGVAETRP